MQIPTNSYSSAGIRKHYQTSAVTYDYAVMYDCYIPLVSALSFGYNSLYFNSSVSLVIVHALSKLTWLFAWHFNTRLIRHLSNSRAVSPFHIYRLINSAHEVPVFSSWLLRQVYNINCMWWGEAIGFEWAYSVVNVSVLFIISYPDAIPVEMNGW